MSARDPSSSPEDAAKPHYHGHRRRLRERFLAGGADALQDYELLELILSLALPRQDVKPLAKQLIETHGSFAAVVSATPERLMQTKGVKDTTAAALKAVQAAALRLARQQVLKKPVLSSWQALLDYCHADMAHREVEAFRVLYLDRKNVLIDDKVQSRGTIDHTAVYPREVVKQALALSASALILVHNHPSGDPTPSKDDVEMTRRIAEAARTVGVTLHDHVVIGRHGHYSFKSHGLL